MPGQSTPTEPSIAPPADPFAPFAPTEADPWSVEKVGHLYRRAAFGATPAQLESALKLAPDAAVKSLLDFDAKVDPFAGMIEQMEGLFNLTQPDQAARWWIHRMLYSPNAAQEKVALFWHNRFATSATKVENGFYLNNQIELFRRQGLGNFRELLVAVTKDPAMLIWLDGNNSKKGKPNENYAREVMELFTLGVGNYSENDIKQLARCFTGWQIQNGGDPEHSSGALNKSLFDEGEKEVFGQKGTFDAEQAIDLILKQPSAPKFLARKMLKEFVHPESADEHVEHYAKRLIETKWEIKPVLAEMLCSRMFFSSWAYRSRIKSPAELCIGTSKAIGGKANTQFLRESMAKMGQSLLYPPNVKGWDGGAAWINANTVLVRFNFGMQLASQRQQEMAKRSDLEGWLKPFNIQSADDVVDHYARVLLDGQLDPGPRAQLIEYMNRNEKNEPTLFKLAGNTVNTKVRGALHLLMSAPEYQLA